MKTMKRILATFVAVMMVAAMLAVPASAADTYAITINNGNDGHTYEAYQIFKGDLAIVGAAEILSNIQWGDDITDTGKTTMGDAAANASGLTADNVVSFANSVSNYLTATPSGSTSTLVDITIAGIAHKGYVISGLEPGYYLVRDQAGSLSGAADTHTSYILEVVSDVTVSPKGTMPTVTNKVADINDSEQTANDAWADSADYDIGDKVPFQITGTLPTNLSDYTTYAYAFHVVVGEGFIFDSDSVKVYVDGTEITSGFTVITSSSDGCTFGVAFDDVKSVAGVTYQSNIVVEYQAELNSEATMGNTGGNTNAVHLVFSNDPYGSTTGETTKDMVKVFTYQLALDKVDKNGVALSGAEFKVEKYNKTSDAWTEVAVVKENGNDAIFVVKGVDDGLYRVTETTTPSGYNSNQPFYVEINATHQLSGAADPQMTGLTSNHADENGNVVASPANVTLNTTNMENGRVPVVVINQAGATLPTTGGMGTTIFYIAGGLMVVAAAAVLVLRKRENG